jgi:hypothetical protein
MRKKIYIISIFILATTNSFAQRVGIGTINPANSAQLEIASTSKGLLIPRVSLSSEKDVATVPSPAISLIVYNTNNNLPDSAGYYYWGGAKWLKLLTNTTAGGDLSGTYPNPVVSKLNNISLPAGTPVFNDDGKTLRYNTFTKSYDLRLPVEFNESLQFHNLNLTNLNGAGAITRGSDNSNMVPLCYGSYAGGSSLSGATDNVSFTKFADGIYQFHVAPGYIGINSTFNPVIVCTITGESLYGFISSYVNGPSDFVIVTRSPSLQAYIDFSFSFVVYNR